MTIARLSPAASIELFVALSVTLLCAACDTGEKPAPGQDLPGRAHLIVITVDTLRADHLGCYGYSRDTSPHLDRLAEKSALFESCYAHASLTTPSCVSILSGLLPHETEMLENKSFLSEDVPMIAERLSSAGYRTCAVVSNWVLNRRRGLDQGFDLYDDEMDQSEANRNQPERTASHTTDRALEMLSHAKASPLFLWVHYQDPHGTYTPPPPHDQAFATGSESGRALPFNENQSGLDGIPRYQRLGDRNEFDFYVSQYDGEIRYLDEQLGRLLDGLKSSGLFDSSLIVFTADHGEALGEHGYYFSHGHNLDHCLLRVPLLVHGAGLEPALRKEPVQHLDIVPTLLQAAGMRADERYRGRSLLTTHEEPAWIFSQRRKNLHSLMVNGLKLVRGPKLAALYDVTRDPEEKEDLVNDPDFKEQRNRLNDLLLAIQKEKRLDIVNKAKPPKLTEEEIEKLQALGYAE